MSDWGQLAEHAAEEAGCFARCPDHPKSLLAYDLRDDLLAQRQQAAWEGFAKALSENGFEGSAEALQGELIFVLQSVDEACPVCGATAPLPENPDHRRPPHPWAS
ncbi:hypothetical protein [Vannielia litorea]|uniref:hypothetical protein n=1 Tax=Vannielia litorea TaxID=1217970 RepID=UPI001C959F47|nr:hypothetical protein [Vannielia litorea]MBY6049652.1 hypothetical protein [Vannielia litorea]MBY6077066.1 hypothetical protein [Vannielia litorea]